MSEKGAVFLVRLQPDAYGSEHQNEYLREADGQRVVLLEELRDGLWKTDFQKDAWKDLENDYVSDGHLLVIPSRDGRIVTDRKRRKSS